MIINGIGSRRFIVNLFSEFLLSKFPFHSKTIIEIADCENFFVVKGKTNYNDIIDISKVKEEFNDKYGEYLTDKLINTIDLIEYNKEIEDTELMYAEFYNSDNPFYSTSQINFFKQDNTKSYEDGNEIMDNFIIVNSFPHTISFGKGKLLYYYAKHIMYNIPSNYPVDKLSFQISKNDIKVYNQNERDLTLESAILDVFDFNMNWLEKEFEGVDFCKELLNPLSDFEFLKKKVKDFIII